MKNLIYISISFLLIINLKAETFAIIGDAGVNNKYQEMVRESIIKSNVRELILPGDNLYDLSKTYEEVWGKWDRNFFNFTTAIGNHHLSYEHELNFFNMPGEYYTKVISGVKFVILNSDNRDNVKEQLIFLNNELANHKEGHLFIMLHHPLVTISARHSWNEREELLRGAKKIINAYKGKVSGVISGHDHLATLVTFNNIPLIVSGAVFESRPFRPVNYRNSEGILVNTEWINKEGFYWVRLDVNKNSSGYWLNFVRADIDEVSCSIYVEKGKVFKQRNCL